MRIVALLLAVLLCTVAHAGVSVAKIVPAANQLQQATAAPTAALTASPTTSAPAMPTTAAATSSPTPTAQLPATLAPAPTASATTVPATTAPMPATMSPSSPVTPSTPSADTIAAAARTFNGVYTRRRVLVTIDTTGRVRLQFAHRDDAFGVVVAADTIRVDFGGGELLVGRFHDCVIDWDARRDWPQHACGAGASTAPRHPWEHRPWTPHGEHDDEGSGHGHGEDDGEDDEDSEYRGHWRGHRHHGRRRRDQIGGAIALVLVVVLACCLVRKCRRWHQARHASDALHAAPMMQLPQALPPQVLMAPGAPSPYAYYSSAQPLPQPPSALRAI